MFLGYWLLLLSTLISLVLPPASQANYLSEATTNSATPCPQPALSRLQRHKVNSGETLESIAQQYNLIPATLIGMNPSLRNGKLAVGRTILIPPYNGIRVEVPTGTTWREVAANYKVRADVLFEVNGCQTAPQVVFVPGVNWSPNPPSISTVVTKMGYPLPSVTSVALGYGWQIDPNTGKVFFHSGLDLLAAAGTSVQTVSAGTVAFAGEQGSYGNLVVINHEGGKQSRYAHLQSIVVTASQKVKPGELVGTVGGTGNPTSARSHLHFELRYASSLGWVAEEPSRYLQQK